MTGSTRSAGDRGEVTYVIGHRNPDTDAICSALGYAEFLRVSGREPQAMAACCGEINDRTNWVLERAGIRPPRLVMDVRPTAESICRRNPGFASEDDTFLEVYQRMSEGGFRSLPVIDAQGKVVGVPTLLELLKLLLPGAGEINEDARRLRANLHDIGRSLEASVANGPGPEVGQEDLIMVVGASTLETVRDRIRHFPVGQVMMIVGDRPRIHRLAIEARVRCLVLTGGAGLSGDLSERAAAAGVCVISCGHDTATTAHLVRCSRRICDAISRDFITFDAHMLVAAIVERVHGVIQPLFPVIDGDTDTLVGVLSKSDLVEPPLARLVLVDHNEFSQAVSGADQADIIEVIDHHRLSGNLVSKEPIRFVNEPVGSTSTMVGRFFREAGLEPSCGIAICLAAGIVSDTLNLTSPTTTAIDREILPWLAEIAGLDVGEFSESFFAAGSVLRKQSPEEAVISDRKEFCENGWKISISQIEELGLAPFWSQEEALRGALEDLRANEKLDFACLMVTDITAHYSVLVTCGNAEVVEEIEYPEIHGNLFEMRGVVSRKKQLFPYLGRILGRLVRSAE
ncbi:putative manganese-dependent inorganic diphosphatase [soil metagenome]